MQIDALGRPFSASDSRRWINLITPLCACNTRECLAGSQTCPFPSSLSKQSLSSTKIPKPTQQNHLPPPQKTLLPPAFSLLLPRTLAVPKRKPARPLIRARSLAHPRRIPAKQQRPSPEAKQRRIANQPSCESKTPPPAHHLRIKIKGGNSLERHRNAGRRGADFVLGGDARAAGWGGGVFAAGGAFFGGFGGG